MLPNTTMLRVRSWPALGCLLVATATSGCAHGAVWRSVKSVPPDAVVLPLKGLRQTGSHCGPTALAILLRAANDPVSVKEIADQVQDSRLDRALTLDLVLYARARGHAARFRSASVPELMSSLSAGHPALLLIDLSAATRLPTGRLWHYVVAYGYSQTRRVVFVHSGVGEKTMTFDRLEQVWAPAGFWLMDLEQPMSSDSREANHDACA